MQPLPTDFLAALAKRYDLSPEQTDALIKRLGDEDTEQMDAESLRISVNALRNRMTGVYTKFSIGNWGPGKLRKLHDLLLDEYRKTTLAGSKPAESDADINALVQTIRAQVYSDIQARCGTMRVLDMEQPIGLGDIYTSVNILEKLSGSRRLGLDELLQDCDLENFDRFLLGQVRHERVPGLEAVARHNQLMILGKPGAGKTTFMKRLAILCNQGEFQPQRVPVFVTLKGYAEATGKPTLQTYIQRQWNACGVEAAYAISMVLGKGQALVLLDGLDEVYETDHGRVLQDIKTFAHQFRNCQCVITCRIAAREYIFEQFTEVEVADFDPEQIAEFATKWFKAKNDPKKAETFIQRLKDNKPIQELATNPLLLTLLCLIFGEAADFPANRAELYKEGLDVLLKKWDGKRNIERDQVYKKLSLKRKEDLLSQLAFETFERGDYFFKQAVVEQHIISYIRNLSGTSDDEEALQLDSEVVLKSIEAQHGLIVERARGIYSFSHLTFQEYFTAQRIISPTAALNFALKNLAGHITKKRYREIFLLSLGMLPEADALLLLMKKEVDQLMVDSTTEKSSFQSFLNWVNQKAEAANIAYKSGAIRALNLERVLTFGFNLNRITSYQTAFYLACNVDKKLSFSVDKARSLHQNLAFTLAIAGDFDRDLLFVLALAVDPDLAIFIDSNIGDESQGICDSKDDLRLLIAKLPSRDKLDEFKNWWIQFGDDFSNELRGLVAKDFDLSYGWQFAEAQKEKLLLYYDANKLLVDCLNSDCYVTKATRQYIEDTLLLPLSEIEKYPVPDAIANL